MLGTTSFGRMAGTDLCAIYRHAHDKPGTADVHRNKNSFTFYLHSLLEQHPELRPVTNQLSKPWAAPIGGAQGLLI